MFVIDFYSFANLLLEIPQLHIDFFVILHNLEVLAKRLFQFIKCAIRMILYDVFTPLWDVVL